MFWLQTVEIWQDQEITAPVQIDVIPVVQQQYVRHTTEPCTKWFLE